MKRMPRPDRHLDHYLEPRLSRRSVLRGLGVTLTLPWLESLARAAGSTAAVAAAPGQSAPRRFATVLFGNGVEYEGWWARGDGDAMELSFALEPLQPFRQDINVLNGLRIFDDTRDEGGSGHMYYFANFLSGSRVKGGTIGCDVSVDQLMAREIGHHTPLPSLNLGVEPVRSGMIFGAPAVCASTFSWSGPTSPIPAQVYPREVFKRLFDSESLAADRSVLDQVLGDSKRLRTHLSRGDQVKLDQYMDSIREIELRIERAGRIEHADAGWTPSMADPSMAEAPEAGLPKNFPEHARLMLDLLVLALATDKTRIATMVLSQDVSDRPFGFIDGVSNTGIHGISHNNNRSKGKDEFLLTNRWHMEQMAYLLGRMKEVDDGNGTNLLDNTLLLYGGTMIDGTRHDPTSVPLVLAGGCGGTVRTGRTLTYEKFEDRRLCNLYLSALQRMGVPMDRFGNSYHPLPDLS